MRLVANLWTLLGHPRPTREWPLERKLDAAAEAGFHAVTGDLDATACAAIRARGMEPIGWFWAHDVRQTRRDVARLADLGVTRATVFLCAHDTPADPVLRVALALDDAAAAAGLHCAVETHRDTATETPEKTTALLAGFRRATNRPMPVTWDFSHHALVKHLVPSDWRKRLVDPFQQEITAAELFHFRPFNGQRAQIPARLCDGRRPSELRPFLEFATDVFCLWRSAPQNAQKVPFVCPEYGPVVSGYTLAHEPAPWHQAIALARDLRRAWRASAS